MEKILKLYKYVDGINDTPFPNNEQQAILYDFTYDAKRMGNNIPTISGTIMHSLCLDELWGNELVYVVYKGEKYFVKQKPTSSYSNEDTRYKHEINFISERNILNEVYFYDVVDSSVSYDKYVSNSSNVVFYGDINELAQRLREALKYAKIDYDVVVDANVTSETKLVTFSDMFIIDVLNEAYSIYKVPHYFDGKTIHFGYTNNNIDTILKYGIDNALLSIRKNYSNKRIINRATGIGGADNIPYYYPNFDAKGVTNILYNGVGNQSAIVSNKAKYRKVKLGDVFTYASANSYTLEYIDKSKYSVTKEPTLLSEPYETTKKYELILDFPFNVDIHREMVMYIGYSKDHLTRAYTRLYRNSELWDKFTTLGTFYYDRLIEGEYNISITLAFEFKETDEKQTITNEDIPDIVDALELSIHTDISGYHNWKLNSSPLDVQIEDYGIQLNVTPKNGDKITFEQVSYIPPQPNLMPPIYRENGGLERFYNALNNTYINPETNEYYLFENPYQEGKQKEEIVSFDYIKPSIVGITNAQGQRIDMFVEFAYDTNDNDEFDENGNYLHPYFFAKLRKFDGDYGFNLFDHAIEENEMKIAMTSGSCGACEFIIGVSEKTQENTVQVDSNGNLLRDSNGNVLFGSPQAQQNDTINNEVWIALKKDIETFGVIMPNATNNYKPSANDTFVILHIDLPDEYILAAENRLKEEIIKHIYTNNTAKFNLSIMFSRIYLADNPTIANSINENARIKVAYNEFVYTLYVSSYSYRMRSDEPLPEIEVELSEELEIRKAPLQKITSTSQQIAQSVEQVNNKVTTTDRVVSSTQSQTQANVQNIEERIANIERILRNSQGNTDNLQDYYDRITKIVTEIEKFWKYNEENNALITEYNVVSQGTMSFGGIDDGESGEGGGTDITSLYDIPEISINTTTLADGQSLVYDATLHKWVNRLVQSGGGGVDMDYVWAALAAETTEKINASHIPDLSGVYLPLTGGTITGSITTTTLGTPGIIINRESGVPYIRFQNSADHINGELGVTTAGELVYYPTIESIGGYGNWNRVLHSGNIAQYMPDLSNIYLPLTGGYMHGNVYFDAGKGIACSNDSANLQIGMYQNNGIFLQGPRLLYSPASGQDFKIWHEGNDGSNSGLDADLLDGLHEISFMRHSTAINLEEIYLRHIGYGYENAGWAVNAGPAMAFGTSTGYTMLMQQQANAHTLYVSFKTPDGNVRDWKTIAFTDEPSFAKYLGSFNGDANTISDGFIGGKLSGAANFPYNYYSFISAGYGNYKLQFNGYNNNLQFRCGSESGLDNKEWRTVAFTDSNITGNAASATKLQTSRKIWGQPFNGTADVTGSMHIPNASAIFWKDKEENDINSLYLTSLNRLILGAGTHAKGFSTYVGGFDFRIRFGENADTGLLMNSSGDILVGTVNAYTKTAKLLVKGDVQVADGDFWLASPSDVNINTPRLYLSSLLSDTKSYVFIQGINETGYGRKAIAFFTRDAANYTDEATEKMRISYNGNVGIGTTTPAYKLDVDGRGRFASGVTLNNSVAVYSKDTTGADKALVLLNDANQFMIGSDIGAAEYSTYLYGHEILFRQKPGGAQPMYISSNGNVLIGYTSDDGSAILNVKGSIKTSSYLSFGYYGKQLTEDPTSTFRTTMFGDAIADARLRTFRANEAFGLVAAKYGAGLAWSTADTHAYINVDHMSSEIVYIGGGNHDKLNWQARLYTSKMSLIPDSTTASYSIGDADHMWGGAYIRSLSTNTIGFYRNSANYIWATEAGGYFLLGVKDKGDMNIQNASLVIKATDIRPGHRNAEVDLGTSTYRWNTIYGASLNLSGSISSGNILPLETNKYTLGSTTLYWANLYTHGISSSPTGGNLLNWYGEGRFWNLMPQTTELHNLGADDKRWASAHIKNVVAYNSVKIGEATLVWDAVNQCLVVDKNFVSNGSISFGGLEPPTEDNYLATNGGTILGNLGIGNASNTGKVLNLYGRQCFWHNTTPTKGVYLFLDSTAGDRLALRNVDNSIAAKFFVYGNLHYQGTISQLSDMRFKHVIEHVCLSSEIIANAPLFKYKRKDSGDDRVYIGSSAQYWQEVAPELTPLVDDYLTLDYATLGVMMGKSNATEIELLKAEVKELRLKVENYERMLNN